MTSGPGERYWAVRADQFATGQLERFRAQAVEWRNGLVGMTGLLAGVTIVSGKQNIATLSPTARTVTMILLAVAFAVLIYGGFRGMRAAYGTPQEPRRLDGLELRRWEHQELKDGRTALRHGQVSLVLGLALVAVATGVTWTDPWAPPAVVVVETQAGTTICGPLDRADATGVTVRGGGSGGSGDPVVVPTAELKSLRVESRCPAPP